MHVENETLDSLSDDELLRRLSDLLSQSRRVEAVLVAHIAEVDRRRLYASRACSSMIVYCREALHLSEPESYLRITVGRAARRFPAILQMLGEGRLHLSGAALLAPHLTQDNAERVLAKAAYRTKRQMEELIVELAPKPDVPAMIRKLPEPSLPRPELRPDGVKNPSILKPPMSPAPASPETAATLPRALQGYFHREP
jgi:hypothetical protein